MNAGRRALISCLLVLVGFTVASPAKDFPGYGKNPKAGKTAKVNGIGLYYETYGGGQPLLLLHPNGGSIETMAPQIRHFALSFLVIAVDSRGHGRSGKGEGTLNYEQMAEDIDMLLDSLELKSVNIVGWSDGGILGLLLAIHHPDKVGKLAIMGANLTPDGIEPWLIDFIQAEKKRMNEQAAEKGPNAAISLELEKMDLMLKQPDIPASDLKKIASPVLVMAGDRDVIRNEHTLLIFQSIPKSQLQIFSGATHMISNEDPKRFNDAVRIFLTKPFKQPDTRDRFR
ncbi:alpha/beta fold hydrolase [Luteolibacter luteus]|uniref:Alpha/beta hydrolase n=1 Tax=Luteolibacter luteus TaxID=2728835 RepID=A0A858RLL6_9BACT|nr:alpha/beta hydrolase [Luteolibacter luteus]QJE98266.1 alpha/beta hydrolase [Luteolibacter luteus]